MMIAYFIYKSPRRILFNSIFVFFLHDWRWLRLDLIIIIIFVVISAKWRQSVSIRWVITRPVFRADDSRRESRRWERDWFSNNIRYTYRYIYTSRALWTAMSSQRFYAHISIFRCFSNWPHPRAHCKMGFKSCIKNSIGFHRTLSGHFPIFPYFCESSNFNMPAPFLLQAHFYCVEYDTII